MVKFCKAFALFAAAMPAFTEGKENTVQTIQVPADDSGGGIKVVKLNPRLLKTKSTAQNIGGRAASVERRRNLKEKKPSRKSTGKGKTNEPSLTPSVQPSMSPSDQPSTSPSGEPSLLPSDQPSTLPSVFPSDQPSTLPSDEPSQLPSDQPSTLPSDKPSTLPSDQPSLLPSDQPSVIPSDQPSTLPSDQPSTLPSDQPSDEDTRGILICKTKDGKTIPPSDPNFAEAVAVSKYSKDGTTNIVELSTLKEDGTTFPQYIVQVYKFLSVWSQILPSGKIKNLNFVDGKMEDIKDEALEYMKELKKFHEETSGYSSDFHIGQSFVKETENLVDMRKTFLNYVSATMGEYDSSEIQMYTELFRRACNENDYTPEEILMNLYGHACGDGEFFSDVCSVNNKRESAGECNYGSRKFGNLFDLQIQSPRIEKPFVDSNFILSTMMEAIFYQAVCLPPASDVCPADPTSEVQTIAGTRMQNSLSAIEEVQANLSNVASCACPCKSYRVIAMRTDIPGVDDSLFAEANLKEFTFDIGDNTVLDHTNIYSDDYNNNNNRWKDLGPPLGVWVYADAVQPHEPIKSDENLSIVLGGSFGVPGHLAFKLTIEENDSTRTNNIFEYDGFLSDLYESSACGTYEKEIILERVSGDDNYGGTITVLIEVTGEDSCPIGALGTELYCGDYDTVSVFCGEFQKCVDNICVENFNTFPVPASP